MRRLFGGGELPGIDSRANRRWQELFCLNP
jgi:hypothetical protein